MDKELNKYIQDLAIEENQKDFLLKFFKDLQKKITVLDFKYSRTLTDKTAISNILNASIEEVKKQKDIIEISKEKLNKTLTEVHKQRNLIEKKNEKLKQLLDHLKQTQEQLVLSEKMASLGELTAGIAHEIQNPLNFINNFSEVNAELIDELQEEIINGNYEEVEVIAKDIKQNEIRISHHGKRADSIVKGMLQHSRKRQNDKEPAAINVLCDEYLRLAYHGLRAKHKDFNATLSTDFDENVGSIKVVKQDLGRVVLNLITNAFYTVNQKKKSSKSIFEPQVKVTTKKLKNTIEIRVKDNGEGIPDNILKKIFQPFFTTKPSGEGTGLGLSMSYDIIKAHRGKLDVLTTIGGGTEFIIELPSEERNENSIQNKS